MGLFRRFVQKLIIDFYNASEAALKFENLDGQPPNGSLTIYYFLTYYAKILYNFGPSEGGRELNLSIADGLEAAFLGKEKIDKSLDIG